MPLPGRRTLPPTYDPGDRRPSTMPAPVEATGGITASWGPFGLQIRDASAKPVWAKITGQATGTNRYAWSQVDDSDTSGTFSTSTLDTTFSGAGTSDENGGPAYEVNGSKLVPTNTKVLLWPAGDGAFWLFDFLGTSALPKAVNATDDTVNGDPATTLSQYAVDNPTTSSPVHQFVVANDVAGASPPTPGFIEKWYTNGTAGGSGLTSTMTANSSGVALTHVLSYSLNGQTGGYTVSESGGDIYFTYAAGTVIDFSAATVTGGGIPETQGDIAAAGSVQGDATLLTYTSNNVTGADGTKGVILSASDVIVIVYNATASTLKAYPPSGHDISALGANNPENMLGPTTRLFYRVTSTHWVVQTPL